MFLKMKQRWSCYWLWLWRRGNFRCWSWRRCIYCKHHWRIYKRESFFKNWKKYFWTHSVEIWTFEYLHEWKLASSQAFAKNFHHLIVIEEHKRLLSLWMKRLFITVNFRNFAKFVITSFEKKTYFDCRSKFI